MHSTDTAMDIELTLEQRQRYSRTIMLEGVGRAGQRRLLRATVAIVGAGALGSTAAMYLGASGIGTLRLVDFDSVDISNLQRQLTYTTDDLGGSKVQLLARRVSQLNPDVNVEIHEQLLNAASIDSFISGTDIIVEGSDNPATKYLVTDAAHRHGIPCILGAVGPSSAQLMVLGASDDARDAGVSKYRQLFPEEPAPDGYTPCSMGGLAGPLPGIIASMQALVTLNTLLGRDRGGDRLLLLDPITLSTRTLPL